MAGSMSLDDLILELRESLHGSAAIFDGDAEDPSVGNEVLKRFLVAALPDMQIKRPLTKLESVTLMAGMPRYSLSNVPDFAAYKSHLWGSGTMPKPWDVRYPGALPRVCSTRDGDAYWLAFDSAPTPKHIGALGATFTFWYFALHVLGSTAATTTIAEQDKGLLMLRAQAEAMRETAIRNASKPVTMRDGLSGVTRNSTPAALHESLMRQFREAP